MSANFGEEREGSRGREGAPGAHCLPLVCRLIQYLCLERDGKSSKEEIKTIHRSELGSDPCGTQKSLALLRLPFEMWTLVMI